MKRLEAIGLMSAAIATFAVLDTTAKYLVTTQGIGAGQVTWLRFLTHVAFSIAVLWPFAFKPSLRSKKPFLQIVRSVLMAATTALNFVALKYLQLDQTVTIFFLTPLIVAALAGPLLGEWIGWHRLIAVCVGFAGVIIVMRPGFGGIHWAVTLSFGATLGYALYNISTRYLAAYDPPEVTQTYSPLAGVVVMLPFAIGEWQWPTDPWIWLLFLSLGVWGGLGHWLLILAHRWAPAPVLSPYIYLGLIWMSFFGYLVFGDVPTWWTLAGGAVVILSGLYLFARERRALGSRATGPAADIATGS